jgi:hypothetical protein
VAVFLQVAQPGRIVMKKEKQEGTPAARYGKLKLEGVDKPLSQDEQKGVFKEWKKDYRLAKERDQSKRR